MNTVRISLVSARTGEKLRGRADGWCQAHRVGNNIDCLTCAPDKVTFLRARIADKTRSSNVNGPQRRKSNTPVGTLRESSRADFSLDTHSK